MFTLDDQNSINIPEEDIESSDELDSVVEESEELADAVGEPEPVEVEMNAADGEEDHDQQVDPDAPEEEDEHAQQHVAK